DLDAEPVSLCYDVHGIPISGGLQNRVLLRSDNPNDPACVRVTGPFLRDRRIDELNLIAVEAGVGVGGITEGNPGVGVRAQLDLQVQVEVGVFFLRHVPATAAPARENGAVI